MVACACVRGVEWVGLCREKVKVLFVPSAPKEPGEEKKVVRTQELREKGMEKGRFLSWAIPTPWGHKDLSNGGSKRNNSFGHSGRATGIRN